MSQPKTSQPASKKKSSSSIQGLKKAGPQPKNTTKVVKQSTTDDPIRGLKMALKAAEVEKLAEQAAELGSGTL